MCTVLLPPSGYPIADNKYININIILYNLRSYWLLSLSRNFPHFMTPKITSFSQEHVNSRLVKITSDSFTIPWATVKFFLCMS